MTGDVPNLEQIVAEVVRRLKLLAAAPEPSATRPAAVPAPTVSSPPVVTAPSSGDELTLDARVVTTATVHGRLGGVRRVVVDRRAVVTPSVKDELRKRAIRLEFCSEPQGATAAAAATDLTVARYFRSPAARRAAASLPLPGGAVERLSEELSPAVACAVESVRDARQVAVVLTDEPLAAVCLLNRHAHVRAARAQGVDEVRQAISAIGANVLVVDPSAVTTNQWHVIIQACRKDLPRGCPATLSAGLA